jgi:ribosome-binding protein aMBF1 (putative translation factor)
MATERRKKTTTAMEILHDRYLAKDPELAEMVKDHLINLHIAEEIYRMRTKAGLTQSELAKLVKTTPSVICRLEDAEYYGHSLSMLKRVAFALNKTLEIKFLDKATKHQAPKDKRHRKAV